MRSQDSLIVTLSLASLMAVVVGKAAQREELEEVGLAVGIACLAHAVAERRRRLRWDRRRPPD